MVEVNTDSVLERFSLLSGLSVDSAGAYLPLCKEAAAEIEQSEREDCGEPPQSSLCAAAGALAFYRYALAKGTGQGGSFSAGDVKVTENGGGIPYAKQLWRETLAAAAPYLKDGGSFLFERTVP